MRVGADRFAELLCRAGSCWVACNVAMNDAMRSVLHDDEYTEHLQFRRDQHKEIAGEDCVRMVAQKRRPALAAAKCA